MPNEETGRRFDDGRLTRLEERLERAVIQLSEHVASCTEIQKGAREHRENQARQSVEMNAKLDKLLLSRAGDAGERRGRVSTVHVAWILLVAAAGVIGFLVEQLHPFAH